MTGTNGHGQLLGDASLFTASSVAPAYVAPAQPIVVSRPVTLDTIDAPVPVTGGSYPPIILTTPDVPSPTGGATPATPAPQAGGLSDLLSGSITLPLLNIQIPTILALAVVVGAIIYFSRD
jgi:hypothetical protein